MEKIGKWLWFLCGGFLATSSGGVVTESGDSLTIFAKQMIKREQNSRVLHVEALGYRIAKENYE